MARHRQSTEKSKRDRELEELRIALEQERRRSAKLSREVATLKRELRALTAETPDRDRPIRHIRRRARREERLRMDAVYRAANYRKGSFLTYLWDTITSSLPVRIISELWMYLRRLRVVSVILTMLPVVGAVAVLTVLSAAALPFLLIGTATLALIGWMRSRRMNHIMSEKLAGKHIRVFIPPRAMPLDTRSFMARSARSMVDDDTAILIVSPYLISSRGVGGKGAYFTARAESEGVYIVRRHYYFILRRRVLDSLGGALTIVY